MAIPNYVFDCIGATGALLILLGFYRTSIGRWKNKSFIYELDNAFGAGLLIVYQYHLHAVISVVLNIIWLIVAFRGLSSFAERYIDGGKRSKRKRR